MRYLCMYKSSKPEGTAPTEEEIARMGKFVAEFQKTCALLATEGCLPSAMGARMRLSQDNFTVTDGPFTESKEIIGGFALIRAKSKEEILEITRQFLTVAGDGEVEIRPVYDSPEVPCGNR